MSTFLTDGKRNTINSNYEKELLILQTLYHEQKFSKNTYDLLSGLLKEMKALIPTNEDYISDFLSVLKPTQQMSQSKPVMEEILTGFITVRNQQYYITLKKS